MKGASLLNAHVCRCTHITVFCLILTPLTGCEAWASVSLSETGGDCKRWFWDPPQCDLFLCVAQVTECQHFGRPKTSGSSLTPGQPGFSLAAIPTTTVTFLKVCHSPALMSSMAPHCPQSGIQTPILHYSHKDPTSQDVLDPFTQFVNVGDP